MATISKTHERLFSKSRVVGSGPEEDIDSVAFSKRRYENRRAGSPPRFRRAWCSRRSRGLTWGAWPRRRGWDSTL